MALLLVDIKVLQASKSAYLTVYKGYSTPRRQDSNPTQIAAQRYKSKTR